MNSAKDYFDRWCTNVWDEANNLSEAISSEDFESCFNNIVDDIKTECAKRMKGLAIDLTYSELF